MSPSLGFSTNHMLRVIEGNFNQLNVEKALIQISFLFPMI